MALPMNTSNLSGTAGELDQADTVAEAGVASDADLDDINLLQGSLAYEIKKAQVRCYEVLFEHFGPDALSPGRMTALCIIGTQPGINQSALADALRVNRASVVKVIDALESLGYVERQSIPEDRRSYALAVTPTGLEELRRLTKLSRSYETIVASQLTLRERKTLFRLLAKVAADR